MKKSTFKVLTTKEQKEVKGGRVRKGMQDLKSIAQNI